MRYGRGVICACGEGGGCGVRGGVRDRRSDRPRADPAGGRCAGSSGSVFRYACSWLVRPEPYDPGALPGAIRSGNSIRGTFDRLVAIRNSCFLDRRLSGLTRPVHGASNRRWGTVSFVTSLDHGCAILATEALPQLNYAEPFGPPPSPPCTQKEKHNLSRPDLHVGIPIRLRNCPVRNA